MPASRLHYLFYRYIDQLATEEERTELMELLDREENGPALLALMEEAWQDFTPAAKRIDDTRSLEMLDAALSAGRARAVPLQAQQRPLLRRLRPWTRVAAAAILVVGGTVLYQALRRGPEPTARIGAPATTPVPSPAADFIRQYRLPDGSTVVLRAGGRLDVPKTFGDRSREVSLSGEAFFTIAADARRPFIIHTGGISTTVLGTAFDIKASNERVVVAVTQGKVKVEKGTKLLAVLEPNHQVTYMIPSDLAREQHVDANAVVTDWTKEDMAFDQASFADIAALLSRRYGTTIVFRNPDIRTCKLKAYFNGTETLEKVLEQLCTISNAKYTRDGEGRIVIDGPGCP